MNGHIRGTAALLAVLPLTAMGANCGHDVHGAAQIAETKLAPNNSIIHYFSPATIVMDNNKTAKWTGLANGGSYFCDDQ